MYGSQKIDSAKTLHLNKYSFKPEERLDIANRRMERNKDPKWGSQKSLLKALQRETIRIQRDTAKQAERRRKR